MTTYLISFDDGAMTFPEEGLPDVADAVRAVRASERRTARAPGSRDPSPHDRGFHSIGD
ncbi:MAG: hypothetical protein LH468_01295 [Nocardioides sp.]|nr:hypothetical protein [Nocardioides sp.]